MNVVIDRAIFQLQAQGGISTLWRALLPRLQSTMPDVTFDEAAHPDLYISTYYRSAPAGCPSIAVVYDFIAEQYLLISEHHPDAIAKRRAIADANAVIAISSAVADDCERFTGRKAVVAWCGGGETLERPLPSAVADFRHRYNLVKSYVLTVGNRGLYKNVQALYQAWGLWQQDVAFVTVGGEETLPQDAAFDRAYPDARVHLRLSESDLACAYAGALALVYPSMFEGFGLPVVEAMACGCPVIGGDAIRQIAEDSAIYANVYQPLSIASALQVALDPSHRFIMAQRGFERAKQFTWDKMAATVAGVIRSAMTR